MPITSQITVYNWFRSKLHKFEDQCPNEGECANIAGNWSYSESGTVTCTYDGETETEFLSGSGTIHINQNGCNVNWRVPDFNVDRTGTVDGNHVQVSGLFAVAIEEGVNFTQNTYTAEGTISGNEINLNGTGIVSGTFCDEDGCYNFSCTTTDDTLRLTRSSYTSVLETMDKKKAIRKPSATFLNNSIKIFTNCGP